MGFMVLAFWSNFTVSSIFDSDSLLSLSLLSVDMAQPFLFCGFVIAVKICSVVEGKIEKTAMGITNGKGTVPSE
jgi:hypothetical protein